MFENTQCVASYAHHPRRSCPSGMGTIARREITSTAKRDLKLTSTAADTNGRAADNRRKPREKPINSMVKIRDGFSAAPKGTY